MFRAQLPRLYELLDLIADPASPKAYFQDFETKLQVEPLCLPVYACWEKVFQILDEDAWKAQKDEAAQYLTCRDKRRGWHQLFDILGQADAYKHLRDIAARKFASFRDPIRNAGGRPILKDCSIPKGSYAK